MKLVITYLKKSVRIIPFYETGKKNDSNNYR